MRRTGGIVVVLAAVLAATLALPAGAGAATKPKRGGEVVWGLEAETSGGW
jgi:hypothetical protein